MFGKWKKKRKEYREKDAKPPPEKKDMFIRRWMEGNLRNEYMPGWYGLLGPSGPIM